MWTLGSWLLVPACDIVPCEVHSECDEDQMCWQGTCQHTTDRHWHVEVSAAEVGAMHPDGYPWDGVDGAPDLYAEFGFDSDACITSVDAQTYDPTWFESCDFYVPSHPTFFVDLWDVDSDGDELGASYTWSGAREFTELARTADEDSGWLDDSHTALLWLYVHPR